MIRRRVHDQQRRIRVGKRMLARAMRDSGHSYRQIAQALDISVGAVHYIVREGGPEVDRLAVEIRKRAAHRHHMLAEHILSSIDDRDIYKAPLKQKIIAAAILTDKGLMLERQSGGGQSNVDQGGDLFAEGGPDEPLNNTQDNGRPEPPGEQEVERTEGAGFPCTAASLGQDPPGGLNT